MSFTLSYGNYSHAADEVVLRSVSKVKTNSRRGRTMFLDEVWTIEGLLQAADTAALTMAMTALEQAYEKDGRDLNLATSAHTLLNSNTMGGAVVVNFTWTSQFKAEYTTFRSYQIVVRGRTAIPELELLEFSETLTISGGLPEYVVIPTRNTPPIAQITSPKGRGMRGVQSGTALGWSNYPIAPAPVFGTTSPPLKDRSFVHVSPDDTRGTKFGYRINWNYQYEHAGELFGELPSAQ